MQKFVLILCGAPGIDKLSAITTQRVASLPETCFMRLNYPENCLFSPFHFFLRHPEAGLGRFCKQVCKHLFECEVAVIQEEQGDIPLLEEIQRSIKKRMSQQEEVMFYKYVVTTLNFALCREGLLKEIGSSLRTLKSTQDKSPKAALSKQIFYQQLAQQIYAESVFVSAWETSENVEEIISLAEENGYKRITVNRQETTNPIEAMNNGEHALLFIFISLSSCNQIWNATQEHLNNLQRWIPRGSVLVVLDRMDSEANCSISNCTRKLSRKLNQTVVGIQLWDGLWNDSDGSLLQAGYTLMKSLISCPLCIAIALLEPNSNEPIDFGLSSAVNLKNVMNGDEESIQQMVLDKWNLKSFVWEFSDLHPLLDSCYLEYHGRSILETCVAEANLELPEESQQAGNCISSVKEGSGSVVIMNPACRNILDKENIRHYASFHPKLIENAEQLLAKHRIQVLFPSFNEAECIMEASQMGNYYHVSFSIQDDPLALKQTHCDCPYFMKQQKMQQSRLLFCKHVLALMILVYDMVTEQASNEQMTDLRKEEKINNNEEVVEKTKGDETPYNTIFQPSRLYDVCKEEYNTPTILMKPEAPRELPAFMQSAGIATNKVQRKTTNRLVKQKSSPVEAEDSESETSSWETSGANDSSTEQDIQTHDRTSQPDNETMESSDYPSKLSSNSFYEYLLFGDISDEEEKQVDDSGKRNYSPFQLRNMDKVSIPTGSVGSSSTSDTTCNPLNNSTPLSTNKEQNAIYEKQPFQSTEEDFEKFFAMDKKPKRSIKDKLASLKQRNEPSL